MLARFGRLTGAAAILLVGLQVLALLWLIWGRAVQAPYWDEWVMVGLLQKAESGTLGIAGFWAFHNEHRIVIPRLTTFVILSLTDWDRRVMLTVNLLVVLMTADARHRGSFLGAHHLAL